MPLLQVSIAGVILSAEEVIALAWLIYGCAEEFRERKSSCPPKAGLELVKLLQRRINIIWRTPYAVLNGLIVRLWKMRSKTGRTAKGVLKELCFSWGSRETW